MIAGLKRRKHCEICNALIATADTHCRGCQDKINEARIWKRRRGEEPGYIYAIGVAGDSTSLVKIGFARSLQDRLKTLQTGSPVMLEVIAAADGRICYERRIHRLLLSSRSHGEWFRRTSDVLQVVDRIRSNAVVDWLARTDGAQQTIKRLRGQYSVV